MRFFLYVDGASRGNPGDAAIGGSLQNANGQEVGTVSQAIGQQTNNEAEYRALIEGLKLAKTQAITDLEVRADSQLVVRQMLGEYKVKHPKMKPLFEQAQALSKQFQNFTITHVPREENKRADELANQALDDL